ncbi:MAG: D-aminoacyl-tRNA deacylase [Halovenus sp.]
MLGIVVSRPDSASVHIGEKLRSVADWETHEDDTLPDSAGGGTVYRTDGATIREFDRRHLDMDRPAAAFDDPSLLVFASRHAGETGQLLTAHYTGNFGPAEYGGEPDELARACPNAHARALEALATYAPEGYDVGMECTHHGPSAVGAPSMFVEVGSAEPQWDDPEAARAVARAILELRGTAPDRPVEGGETADDAARKHLVGVGGGHYAPRFERIVRETEWAVGHVAADWGLDALGDLSRPASERVLRAAFEESRAAYALVEDAPEAREAVEALGFRAVGETWVRETAGVPLPFVRAAEAEVGTVADGLRFGEPATALEDTDWTYTVASLPAALLEEVRGIDRDTTRRTLREAALAFGTDQGGTRVTGPAVLADPADRERILGAFCDILGERYDTVEREAGAIVAREQRFDPELARTLGVPEGPKFGRLADGQPVEVDGETIPPDAVRTERERRLPLEE